MLDLFESIAFGFRMILKWDIVKTALISGLLMSGLWIIIGLIFWSPLVSVSGFMLDLVPFSMVRSNGAEIISIFAWVQVVLITFAILVAFFGTLLSRKIDQQRYSYFYIITLTCSVAFWVVVWFFEGAYLHDEFLKLLNLLPFETIDRGMAYLIACLILYNAIIVSMLFVVSVMSKKVLFEINREYFDNEMIYDREFKIIKYTIKDTLLFFVASLVLFPLFFIPILNWIIQVVLWSYLVRNTFKYDTSALLFKNIDKEILKKKNRAIWAISFISTIFNFIPFLNVFGPFFGEISIFHYLKTSKE